MKLMRYNHPNNVAELMRKGFRESFFNDQLDRGHCGHLAAANIIEDEKGYRIEVVVPGLSREDIEIHLEKNRLTITSKEQDPAETKNYLRREFYGAKVERSFNISERIDTDKITAQCANGILSLELPLRSEDLKLRERREISIS